jgi:hypothetical protein
VIVSPDYAGEHLVFVVGCPRSGTTWVQRLLSLNPQVRTGQESNLFVDSIGLQLRRWRRGLELQERGGVGLACYFTETEMLELLREFMCKLLQRMLDPLAEGQFFVEKTPDHALYLPEIIELLPASRIIHVIRDPRDVVASLLAASRTWASESTWAPGSAREGTKLWMRSVSGVSRIARKKQHSKRLLEVRYEDLHNSPIESLARVRDFIGLDWSEEEMQRVFEANRMTSPSGQKISQPLIPLSGQAALVSGPHVNEPKGFLRKGTPGSWRSDLSLLEKFWVWKLGRNCARDNGYQIGWLR